MFGSDPNPVRHQVVELPEVKPPAVKITGSEWVHGAEPEAP